jgi:PAS domain S-box-containing protein
MPSLKGLEIKSMSSNYSMITIDQWGTILAVSGDLASACGYDQQNIVGKEIRFLIPQPSPSKIDEYLKFYRDVNNDKIVWHFRGFTGRRSDGSLFPVNLIIKQNIKAENRCFKCTVETLNES